MEPTIHVQLNKWWVALRSTHPTLLLGYDHADPEAGQRMRAMEIRILSYI